MRTCWLCAIALVCFAGCSGDPDLSEIDLIEDEVEAYFRLCENGPPRPFVSLAQVEERDGRMVWKESGKPFTGTLVVYGGGRRLRPYLRGHAHLNMIPDFTDTYDHLSSAEEIWRDAFRYYIARNAPGHNEYGLLVGFGEESDIPMLLAGLRSFPKREDGGIVCTHEHCVDALRAITGADVGYAYSDWAAWWKQKYGTDVPDWKPGKFPEEDQVNPRDADGNAEGPVGAQPGDLMF